MSEPVEWQEFRRPTQLLGNRHEDFVRRDLFAWRVNRDAEMVVLDTEAQWWVVANGRRLEQGS